MLPSPSFPLKVSGFYFIILSNRKLICHIIYKNNPETSIVQNFFLSVWEISRHDFEQKRYAALKYSALKMMNGFLKQLNRSSKGCGDQDGGKKEHEGERRAIWTLHKPKALIRTCDPLPHHPMEKKWWIFPPLHTRPHLCSAVDQIFIVKPWQYFPCRKKSLFRAWVLGGKTLYLATFFFFLYSPP